MIIVFVDRETLYSKYRWQCWHIKPSKTKCDWLQKLNLVLYCFQISKNNQDLHIYVEIVNREYSTFKITQPTSYYVKYSRNINYSVGNSDGFKAQSLKKII